MNILFLTLLDFDSFTVHNIYCDLLRELRAKGHNVYCVSPAERRTGLRTHLLEDGHLLKLKIGNTQKTNIIEKGMSTLLIESQFVAGIKKYFANVRYDLVMYSTPPITLAKAVRYVQNRDGAKSYLLLKDIFPQNAVDIGMMKKGGVTGILYKHFRRKEKKLYAISDRIGCMSQANVDYVLKDNPEVPVSKVEICPNSIEVQDMSISAQERMEIRDKYGIPQNKKVFIYGGNLGKPQGIPFLMDCLKSQMVNKDAYYLIVGDGTEFGKLESFFNEYQPQNMQLLKKLPKEDYDHMVAACDVGMIFLDHRFTIPNFPSRLLAYMQAKLPVLACTDPNTDVGKVITEGGFGWWCESNDPAAFVGCVEQALSADLYQMGESSVAYLNEHYNVKKIATEILDRSIGVMM